MRWQRPGGARRSGLGRGLPARKPSNAHAVEPAITPRTRSTYCGICTTLNVCAGPIGVTVSPVLRPSVARYGARRRPACPGRRRRGRRTDRRHHRRRRRHRRAGGWVPAGGSARRFHATRRRPAVLSTSMPPHLPAGVVGDGQHQLGVARQRLLDVIGEHGAERGVGRGPQARQRAEPCGSRG